MELTADVTLRINLIAQDFVSKSMPLAVGIELTYSILASL
jgi:hypothetical protein